MSYKKGFITEEKNAGKLKRLRMHGNFQKINRKKEKRRREKQGRINDRIRRVRWAGAITEVRSLFGEKSSVADRRTNSRVGKKKTKFKKKTKKPGFFK